MRFYLILAVISLCLTACNADKLNGFAARLNKNVQEKVEYFTSSSSNKLPDSSASRARLANKGASNGGLSSLEEASNTLKEINQSYKETKEQVKETKAEIRQGVREAKDSVKRVARKMPRSEKEANKMFFAFAEKYFGDWRGQFKRFAQLFRQKRQVAGQSKDSKLSANRQR